MDSAARRPGLVTALVVLVVLAGIGSILAGIVAMTTAGSVGAGVVSLVIGLVYLGVAKGLLDGRNWARLTAAVVAAVNVIFAILTIINSDGSSTRSSSIGTGVFSVIILAILFSPKANAFFGSRSLSAGQV
jgi:hypothetical protein